MVAFEKYLVKISYNTSTGSQLHHPIMILPLDPSRLRMDQRFGSATCIA